MVPRSVSIAICILLLAPGWGRAQIATPRALYGDLFVRVQMDQVFADQKVFPDCMCLDPPAEILSAYDTLSESPGFSLEDFVRARFLVPGPKHAPEKTTQTGDIIRHIDSLWSILSRPADTTVSECSSALPLPFPYIVPGGRFREMYYWDSYFTMLGLEVSQDTSMIISMINNFSYLLKTYGLIPNGTRTYYLSRSQPPVFSLMVSLLGEMERTDSVFLVYLPALRKEYDFWMNGGGNCALGRAAGHCVNVAGILLNRYYDAKQSPREESFREDSLGSLNTSQPVLSYYGNIRAAAESGWDFSSRWFAGRDLASIATENFIPVDLNCLLWNLEKTLSKAYLLAGKVDSSSWFSYNAERRKQAIIRYCWDPEKRFFCDYDWLHGRSAGRLTLAGAFPLFFGICSDSLAALEEKVLCDSMLCKGGLRTTTIHSGQQWDAPNGWAPLEYIAIEGLEHYGFDSLAVSIAGKWIALNIRGYRQSGKLMEKYNVEQKDLPGGGGEYPGQDGFGWTNGVLLKLILRYGMPGDP